MFTRLPAGFLLLGAAMVVPSFVTAETLPDGFVIDAGNVDRALVADFEGQPVKELLLDRTVYLIREHNLKIRIGRSLPLKTPARMLAVTKKYAGQASLEPTTHYIKDWTAGLPFPAVTPQDSDAGWKVIWNVYLGGPVRFDVLNYTDFEFQMVSGETGIERTQTWAMQNYTERGRWMNDNPIEGDGSVIVKKALFATYPQDLKGIGTLTIEYYDDKPDDAYVYVKAVRRIRRISGDSWSDPIGGTDYLHEDDGGFTVKPSHYANWRVVEKKLYLMPVDPEMPYWNKVDTAKSLKDKYIGIDFTQAPYWHLRTDYVAYRPRETWVLEGTAPERHPFYSKKVVYIDADTWAIPFAETFDKAGNFWKAITCSIALYKQTSPPAEAPLLSACTVADYQRMHATTYAIGEQPDPVLNTPGITSEDITPQLLTRGEPARPHKR